MVIEREPQGEKRYPIVQAMGGKNVFYFLTPLERGWLQVLPVAYDVRRQEWFDTTASAMRHFGDRRDEALYWKERPLTFNTSCFSCHVSQLSKNYDLKSDSYHTTWAEPGINCETCHGPSAEHVAACSANWPTNQPAPADIKLIVTSKLTTEQRNATCAPCHAKMSPVTMNFAPGDRYFDHFDLVGFENADFYPDGRDLGENYTYTQWRLSPCAKSGQAGLHPLPHLERPLPLQGPGQSQRRLPAVPRGAGRRTPPPTRTTRRARAGNECISCHMPMTEFARMRRSDHSMRPPTPATTLALQLAQRLQPLPHQQGRRLGRQARARVAQARLPEAGARTRRPDRRRAQAATGRSCRTSSPISPAPTARKSRPSRWSACWPTAPPTTNGRCCGS